jgi:MFS family permease
MAGTAGADPSVDPNAAPSVDPSAGSGSDASKSALAHTGWSMRTPRSSRSSFALIAAIFALVTTGGTLPIPLYTLWGADLGFGASTTTWIFAIYVLGTLLALVFFGGLSDQVGRRPLVLAALVVTIVSTLLFLNATSVTMLLLGRLLSGVGVGLITSPATAALAESYRGSNQAVPAMVSTAANMGGLGLGPLVAGVFAQYLPAPTTLIFLVFLAAVVAAAVVTFLIRETHPRQPGAAVSWTLRVGVPRSARKVYVRSAIAVFPTFTLLGLFSSLTPRFIRETLDLHNLVIAGLATFVLFEVGVTAQLTMRRRSAQWLILRGLPALIVSLALVLTGLLFVSFPIFALGTIIGGFGAGMSFLGGLRQLSASVPHPSHAKAVAAYFIAAQSGLALPVLAIGALTTVVSLSAATAGVIGVVVVLAALALSVNATARGRDEEKA